MTPMSLSPPILHELPEAAPFLFLPAVMLSRVLFSDHTLDPAAIDKAQV